MVGADRHLGHLAQADGQDVVHAQTAGSLQGGIGSARAERAGPEGPRRQGGRWASRHLGNTDHADERDARHGKVREGARGGWVDGGCAAGGLQPASELAAAQPPRRKAPDAAARDQGRPVSGQRQTRSTAQAAVAGSQWKPALSSGVAWSLGGLNGRLLSQMVARQGRQGSAAQATGHLTTSQPPQPPRGCAEAAYDSTPPSPPLLTTAVRRIHTARISRTDSAPWTPGRSRIIRERQLALAPLSCL